MNEYNIHGIGCLNTSSGPVWQFHRGPHTVTITSDVLEPTPAMYQEAKQRLDLLDGKPKAQTVKPTNHSD